MEIKNIQLNELEKEMSRLKNEQHFDFLRNLTGMDWGEEKGLGVVYQLENTETGDNINVDVATIDRENPFIPSVTKLWKAANFLEREVYDFYGIKFLGHPDMRRLYLRCDFKGYPLRKDYDMSDKNNPIPTDDEPESGLTNTYELTQDSPALG